MPCTCNELPLSNGFQERLDRKAKKPFKLPAFSQRAMPAFCTPHLMPCRPAQMRSSCEQMQMLGLMPMELQMRMRRRPQMAFLGQAQTGTMSTRNCLVRTILGNTHHISEAFTALHGHLPDVYPGCLHLLLESWLPKPCLNAQLPLLPSNGLICV